MTQQHHAEIKALKQLLEANDNAADIWRRRAWDMKQRLDAVEGGYAVWIDVQERSQRRFRKCREVERKRQA